MFRADSCSFVFRAETILVAALWFIKRKLKKEQMGKNRTIREILFLELYSLKKNLFKLNDD